MDGFGESRGKGLRMIMWEWGGVEWIEGLWEVMMRVDMKLKMNISGERNGGDGILAIEIAVLLLTSAFMFLGFS
jgi:hypothetical protein